LARAVSPLRLTLGHNSFTWNLNEKNHHCVSIESHRFQIVEPGH